MGQAAETCASTVCGPPRRRGLLESYRDVIVSRDFAATAAALALILLSVAADLLGSPTLATILALAGVAVGGLFIVVGAVEGLISRELNVDELVSIAIVASVLVGEYLSAAFVAFMMLAGKMLEDFTAQRAANALGELASLSPKAARVRRDGVEEKVPVEALRPGDLVLVRSGEAIPVDGEVVSGQASVNQAAITGESMPVPKGKGSEVYAGTMNELGALEIRTSRVGDDTTLGRIASLVEEAESNRAPIVRVADRYARYFTPVILGLAALVFLATRNPISAVTVLIVACPCALVMATPTAIIAGVANAARRGILIKGGARLEAAGKVDAVAIDKTGTLSLGEPEVHEVITLDGWDQKAVLELATAAEKFSEHPLGRAVVRKGGELGIVAADPDAFEVVPGRGVLAEVSGRSVVLGTADLLRERGIPLDDSALDTVSGLQERGRTALLMAVDGKVRGSLGLADRIRPEAGRAITRLRATGVRRIVMLTGDNKRVAAAVAAQAGIDEYAAELLPEQKVERVRKLQAEGYRVAMVGDGINDAPALAAADAAVAMGAAGSDIAVDTADIALMTGDIAKAAEALGLSRKTLTVIKQNIAFALFWNAVALILAGSGVLSPIAGALVHNVGSVAVVANSARLVTAQEAIPSASMVSWLRWVDLLFPRTSRKDESRGVTTAEVADLI